MTRRVRWLALLLATFAIGLQALWPLLAQAKPRSAIQVPVCTVEGVTHYVELQAAETPLEQRSSSNHDHCAFCTLAADRVAAPQSCASLALPDLKSVQPAAFVGAPVERVNHSLARPRAPPVFS